MLIIVVLRTIGIALCLSFLASCAAPLRSLSQQELLDSYKTFATAYNKELTKLAEKSYARLKYEYLNQDCQPQSYDILVLSGGGSHGAFGAGFLKGWGEIQQGEYVRPEFDSVSGISTGALIAPFAFVGTQASYDSIVDLYRNPDEDLVIARTILAFLAGNRSYYDATKLHKRIKQSITADLVHDIGQQSLQHKVLLVGATNLDYGIMRVWDLAHIAAESSSQVAEQEITTKLIASSAIPGAFPPVNMNKYLYVDGGASMQVVSGIDDREWLYQNEPSSIDFVTPDSPIRIRIWVIINNKLIVDPEVTSPTWSAIATRSLVSLMRGSTLQTLQDVETFSQMINKRPEFDVQMRYVSIPQEYDLPQSSNLFDADKMRELVELGEKLGADVNSWKNRALRPGAPILNNPP